MKHPIKAFCLPHLESFPSEGEGATCPKCRKAQFKDAMGALFLVVFLIIGFAII